MQGSRGILTLAFYNCYYLQPYSAKGFCEKHANLAINSLIMEGIK